MKLREGNVFGRVCLSVHREEGSMWTLPMIGPHCTAPPRTESWPRPPASDIWLPRLESCSNVFPSGPSPHCWHLVAGYKWWASGWYASYWNAVLSPPANVVCEGYVFYTCLSVILFTGGECLGRYIPPWTKYTPWTRYTPQARYPPGPGTPPLREQYMTGDTGQQAGGTHPTGMHSCYFSFRESYENTCRLQLHSFAWRQSVVSKLGGVTCEKSSCCLSCTKVTRLCTIHWALSMRHVCFLSQKVERVQNQKYDENQCLS